jgi:hypothetical protein
MRRLRLSAVLFLTPWVCCSLLFAQGRLTSLDETRQGKGLLKVLGQTAVELNKAHVQLRADGNAIIEVFGVRPAKLRGRWTAKAADSAELTITDGLGSLEARGKGKVTLKEGSLERIEINGSAQKNTFQLTFKGE